MADTKISALPAVAVPAVGDEFACNQAGVTKKETKAQITAATDANLTAHAAVTAAGVHGSSVLTANDRLVHRSAAGLAHAVAFRADAGAVGAPGFTFTADPNTGLYNYAADELGIATGGAHRAHWNTTGALILNDAAASTFMTGPGVTIQQGAKDDEAIAVQSTDVAHGMTAIADTDTYAVTAKVSGASGGANYMGFKDADGPVAGTAVRIDGYLGENADTIKTAAGRAIVEVRARIKAGANIGDTNPDGNVFAIRTHRGGADVTLLLVDEDADLHVLNDIVVAGVVDTIDVANHVHTAAAGMGPQIPTGGIANDAVTDPKLRNSAATSVIGRAGAGVGDPADIVAGVNDRVLSQAAGTVAFRQVSTPMIANDAVDDTKAGDRVPQFYRRQGNSATNWATSGVNTYIPTAVRMQCGVRTVTYGGGGTRATVAVTFPVAFSQVPIVFVTRQELAVELATSWVSVDENTIAAGGCTILAERDAHIGVWDVEIAWLAIGAE